MHPESSLSHSAVPIHPAACLVRGPVTWLGLFVVIPGVFLFAQHKTPRPAPHLSCCCCCCCCCFILRLCVHLFASQTTRRSASSWSQLQQTYGSVLPKEWVTGTCPCRSRRAGARCTPTRHQTRTLGRYLLLPGPGAPPLPRRTFLHPLAITARSVVASCPSRAHCMRLCLGLGMAALLPVALA